MNRIEMFLREGNEKGASDIHLAPGSPVMFRIDGELVPASDEKIKPFEIEEMIEPLLTEEQKAELKENGELDFAYSIAGFHRVRFNVFRQRGTYAVALRILSFEIPEAKKLGIPPSVVDLTNRKRGLVLVTGPTGSGKSTTLASLIHIISETYAKTIITLEDPIEYLHSHEKSIVNQREVGIDTQSYAGALRAALREDPDIILVGEMRDLDTIATAVTAAETGHLVLSTLHTIGAVPTIERIIDVFPMNQQAQIRLQLATLLEAIISQQLLPTADRKGRVAAFEIMYANSAVRNLIREAKPHQIPSIIQTNKQSGMMMMDDALYELYRTNQITAEDAMTFAQDPSNLARRIPAGKIPTPLSEPSWQMDDWDGPTFGSGGF